MNILPKFTINLLEIKPIFGLLQYLIRQKNFLQGQKYQQICEGIIRYKKVMSHKRAVEVFDRSL